MHFGFTLDSSVIDLWNTDLLDAYLDLLDTDIFSKHYVCLLDVLQISSRHVFKTPWRRLQRNNFSSSRTFSRRFQDVLRDVFKTPSRRLQDILEDEKLLRWVLKTSWRCLEDQQMFAGKLPPYLYDWTSTLQRSHRKPGWLRALHRRNWTFSKLFFAFFSK